MCVLAGGGWWCGSLLRVLSSFPSVVRSESPTSLYPQRGQEMCVSGAWLVGKVIKEVGFSPETKVSGLHLPLWQQSLLEL